MIPVDEDPPTVDTGTFHAVLGRLWPTFGDRYKWGDLRGHLANRFERKLERRPDPADYRRPNSRFDN